jgi:hypothetical protein
MYAFLLCRSPFHHRPRGVNGRGGGQPYCLGEQTVTILEALTDEKLFAEDFPARTREDRRTRP